MPRSKSHHLTHSSSTSSASFSPNYNKGVNGAPYSSPSSSSSSHRRRRLNQGQKNETTSSGKEYSSHFVTSLKRSKKPSKQVYHYDSSSSTPGSEIYSKYPSSASSSSTSSSFISTRKNDRRRDFNPHKLQDPAEWYNSGSKDGEDHSFPTSTHPPPPPPPPSSLRRDNGEAFLSKKRNNNNINYQNPSGNQPASLSKVPFHDISDDTSITSPKETWYSLKIPLTPVASQGHHSGDSSSESANSHISRTSKSGTSSKTSKTGSSKGRSSYTTIDPYYYRQGGGTESSLVTDFPPSHPSSYSRLVDSGDHKTTSRHVHEDEGEEGDFYYRSNQQGRDTFSPTYSASYSGRHERLNQKDINHSFDLKAAGGSSKEPSTLHRVTDGLEKDTGGSKSYYYTKSSHSHIRHKARQPGISSYSSNTDDLQEENKANTREKEFSPHSDQTTRVDRNNFPGSVKWSDKVSNGFKTKSNYRPDDRPPIEQDEDVPVILGRTIAPPPAAASVSLYHKQENQSSDERDRARSSSSSSSSDFDDEMPSVRKNTNTNTNTNSSSSHKLSSKQSTKLIVKSIQDILDSVRNSES